MSNYKKFDFFKLSIISLLIINLFGAVPTFAQSDVTQPENSDDVTVEDIEPNFDPNADVTIDENAVNYDVNPNFEYSPDIQVGGEQNSVILEPSAELRDGRLSVDARFDPSQAINSLKTKAIDSIKDFVLDNLGAGDFITKVNQDLSLLTGDIKTFLGLDAQEVNTGDLGIPNVQEARIRFNNDTELSKLDDILGTQTGTTYGIRNDLYQQYLRDLTQGYSENSALSNAGQSKINLKIQSVNAAAEQSMKIAEDSTDQDISQNLFRNLSNQMAIEQQTDAIALGEMEDAKIDRSLNLQLNSEILRELSESNTSSERETSSLNNAAESSFILVNIPGQK
jgi:hypothetical protein